MAPPAVPVQIRLAALSMPHAVLPADTDKLNHGPTFPSIAGIPGIAYVAPPQQMTIPATLMPQAATTPAETNAQGA